MDPHIFNQFRDIIYDRSGITLGPHKLALLNARLGKRMRALSLKKHEAYLKHLMDDQSGAELVQLLDAISTNLTSFFRETPHFALLSKLVTEWLEAGARRLRIWSSACSTGEEPYSIAITLHDLAQQYNADIKILATDISTRVLKHACEGVYDKARLQQISPMLRHAAFRQAPQAGKNKYEVMPHLKEMILFRRLNLVESPYPLKGPLDLIFCRNVMIYFDNKVREQLLGEFHRLLKPGGYLLVGHSESLTSCRHPFKPLRPSVYRK